MPKPKNDEKDPGDSAQDAANGPGQIGDAIVGGLKTLGEVGDKVKNAPGSAVREAKNGVKKGRKLLGLKKGGVLPKYASGTSTQLLTSGFETSMPKSTTLMNSDVVGQTPLVPDTVAPVSAPNFMADAMPRPKGNQMIGTTSGGGGGGGSVMAQIAPKASREDMMGLRGSVGYKDGGVVKESSGSLIRKGLDGAALGGFITQKGLRQGSKGVAGKRMPKKGVMA